MSKNRRETSKMSKYDQTFKKPGKNGQKYLKTVKNVKKPGENRKKYRKNV